MLCNFCGLRMSGFSYREGFRSSRGRREQKKKQKTKKQTNKQREREKEKPGLIRISAFQDPVVRKRVKS